MQMYEAGQIYDLPDEPAISVPTAACSSPKP